MSIVRSIDGANEHSQWACYVGCAPGVLRTHTRYNSEANSGLQNTERMLILD
jgi:hypothetical protein